MLRNVACKRVLVSVSGNNWLRNRIVFICNLLQHSSQRYLASSSLEVGLKGDNYQGTNDAKDKQLRHHSKQSGPVMAESQRVLSSIKASNNPPHYTALLEDIKWSMGMEGGVSVKEKHKQSGTTKPSRSPKLKKTKHMDLEMTKEIGGSTKTKSSSKLLEHLILEQTAFANSQKEVEHNMELESFVRTSVACGEAGKAYACIKYFCERSGVGPQPNTITSPEVFNIAIQGFVERENMEKVTKIIEWMTREGVTPNIRTIGALLSNPNAEFRSESSSAFVKVALDMASEYSLPIEDIFKSNFFPRDARQTLVKAIRFVKPDFKPSSYSRQHLDYQQKLLEPLNSTPAHFVSSPYKGVMTEEELLGALERQLKGEMEGEIEVTGVWVGEEERKTTRPNLLSPTQTLDQLHTQWKSAIAAAFPNYKEKLKMNLKTRQGITVTPYLCILDDEDYVDILFKQVLQLCDLSQDYSLRVSAYFAKVGTEVMRRFHNRIKREKLVHESVRQVYKEYLQLWTNEDEYREVWGRHGDYWRKSLERCGLEGTPDFTLGLEEWPYKVKVDVGAVLFDIILNDVKMGEEPANPRSPQVPCFMITYRPLGRIQKRCIAPRPSLVKLVEKVPDRRLFFKISEAPMVVPSVPWTSFKSGGYLLQPSEMVRSVSEGGHFTNYLRVLSERTSPGEIRGVLDALNQMAGTCWKVNDPVLDVMLAVFRQKGGSEQLAIPARAAQLEYPKLPGIKRSTPPEEAKELWKERFRIRKEKMETHSLWCTAHYKLSLANHFRGQVLWFPHNIDFRGRAYPVPSDFNHMGDDTSRGLLVFAKGEALGPHGLDWLKIHCINLTGTMKRNSIKERLAKANESMDLIVDSAEHPLDGKGWWKEAEDPWQTLGCCMELAEAIKCPSPEDFISHLPVHQDGSCNGLQHYAALGRDLPGAAAVNVYPSERPEDVYHDVALLVEEKRRIDAERYSEDSHKNDYDAFIAHEIGPNVIQRKVVKQTVMTVVYGVTFYGGKLQVLGQLKDLELVDPRHQRPASSYITKAVFQSLSNLFTGARNIQNWFNTSSQLIATHCKRTVEWRTPLGLPCVQPYMKKRTLATPKHKVAYVDLPDTVKQVHAFAPNFIHSLDSTHMMLTALYSQHEGMTFASVHDCYWTHASSVDHMNRVCREQFLALHQQPILNDLSNYFIEQYLGRPSFRKLTSHTPHTVRFIEGHLEKIPPKGTLDLESVLESVYFFS